MRKDFLASQAGQSHKESFSSGCRLEVRKRWKFGKDKRKDFGWIGRYCFLWEVA